MSEQFRDAVEKLVCIRLETIDGIGSTDGKIKAIDLEDDGSVTIVVIAWPEKEEDKHE